MKTWNWKFSENLIKLKSKINWNLPENEKKKAQINVEKNSIPWPPNRRPHNELGNKHLSSSQQLTFKSNKNQNTTNSHLKTDDSESNWIAE